MNITYIQPCDYWKDLSHYMYITVMVTYCVY